MSDIKLLYSDGEGTYDITNMVTGATWSGDVTKAYRSLSVTLSNTDDGIERKFNVELGREVRFYEDDSELFRGIIFSTEVNESGAESVTAYDYNVYLTKNEVDKKFVGLKASNITKRLCKEFEIPFGQIDDTEYVIPKLLFTDGSTLYDMILTAITVTEKQTGVHFFISNKEGNLELRKRGSVTAEWIIERGSNLTGASYKKDIEDLRSVVKVVSEDTTEIVRNEQLIERFGTMQHFEKPTEELTKSQVKQRANQLLNDLGTIADEANVDALGIPEVTAGTSVYVRESMTNILGGYYVISDSHTFNTDGSHTMSLTLSATDDLPKLEYNEPAEEGE